MKIGTRITLTTTVMVAFTLGAFAYFTLRSFRLEREAALARRARELATALRTAIEGRPWNRAELEDLLVDVNRGLRSHWTVELFDASSAPPPDAPPTDNPRVERLRRLLAARGAILDEDDTRFVYLEPVREPSPLLADGFRIVGAIQLSRDKAFIDESVREDRNRMLITLGLILAVWIGAVAVLTRRTVTRPMQKLLAGIDDVAKGDLSHVLLQEREDEIGALSARFNDMTASLRESREETRRSVEARLALETHLRRTEKLATIGQVAAEIAHEVGTPLNVVTGRAKAMSKRADDPDAVQKNAGIIAEQAQRITRIIQRLLDFARRGVGEAEKAPLDLHQLAVDTIEFLEHQLEGARVKARVLPDEAAGRVAGDRDQIQQVLLNLFMNAIQAMPEGGTLEVRTSRVVRRRPGLELAPEQTYAVLEVADTGIGIADEDREKIFEPFYTSKADKGGTGLGLVVAHGIVKDHDGWMEIDHNQRAGRGAVFRVYLPAADGVAAELVSSSGS